MINRKVDKTDKGQYDEIICWKLLKENDKAGLEGLYLKFSRELFKYGMAVQADRDLVKDCIQELFIDLWKYRENLKNTDNVKVYLCRSLSNKIFRALHLEKREKEHNQHEVYSSLYDSESQSTEAVNESAEENVLHLHKAIEKLPQRQKEIIQHVYFDKLSSEEVSEKMGIAVQSVYTLTWKALSKLKKSFLFVVFLL